MIKLAPIFNDHSPQVVNTLDLLYWPSVADLSETNEILQHIQKFERHSRDIPIQILRQRNFAYAKLKNCVNNTSERGELPDCYRIFLFFFYNKTFTHKPKNIHNNHQVYYRLLHLGKLKN